MGFNLDRQNKPAKNLIVNIFMTSALIIWSGLFAAIYLFFSPVINCWKMQRNQSAYCIYDK